MPPRALNILLTDDGLDWTPRQSNLLRMAQALLDHCGGLAIVCPSRSELRSRAVEAGIRILDLDFIKHGWLEAARRLRTLERRAKVDLIHAHGRRDARACLPLHLTGTPIVRSCDGEASGFTTFGLLKQGCRRVIAGTARTSTGLSERGFRHIVTLDGGDPERAARALLTIYADAVGTR